MQLKHLILDRDGVLNREARALGIGASELEAGSSAPGTWILEPAQWQWETGALEALQMFSRAGIRISVVTNQSCIGRGIASREQVDAVNARMLSEAEAAGAVINSVFVCPHAPNDMCVCRKPSPGLVLEAIEDSAIPAAHTLLIGDAERDLEAGRASGVRSALVRTGKGLSTERRLLDQDIVVYDDLRRAAVELL